MDSNKVLEFKQSLSLFLIIIFALKYLELPLGDYNLALAHSHLGREGLN
jgi:hypothetical protein